MKTMHIVMFLGVFMCSAMYLKCTSKSPKVGENAPAFSLSDENGIVRTLEEFKGKKVVLYFYPKDNTPGCTAQACSLRDGYAELAKNGVTVLGVSFDSVDSHKKFKDKHHLPFILLSDSNKNVAKAYGASKSILGFTLPVPLRKTFLINEQGIIVRILDNVDVKNHAQEIIQAFHKS